MQDTDAQELLHPSVKLPIDLICWNVNGLQSSMPAVQHILQGLRPLALVLAETHMISGQVSEPWFRTLHADYHVHAICFPDRNPLASGVADPLPRVIAPSRNRAGVLIAVHKAYIQDQHVSNHQIPSALKGFLQHVCIYSPHSHSLHISGAYSPPQSSSDWMQIQQGIFEYVHSLQARLRSSGSKLLMTGDFNAALHTHHRASRQFTAIDRKFHACLDH